MHVASQVYVWMQHYERAGEPFETHLHEVFNAIAEAGYSAIEMFMRHVITDEQAECVNALLERHKLQLVSVYHGGVMHLRDAQMRTIDEVMQVAEHLRAMGCEAVTFNPSPKQDGEKTDAELQVQAEGLSVLGKELQAVDMKLAVHHHAWEICNGARELRTMMSLTDPHLVRLCLDLHWVLRGGEQPLVLLDEFMQRLQSLHMRNTCNGVTMEALNDGDIDYRAVADRLRCAEFDGWLIVELLYEEDTQVTKSIADNLRISREYVRDVFGV